MGNPVWDEAITFHDVAMTDMLIIRLFEHRKFRVGDACLGQARKLSRDAHA